MPNLNNTEQLCKVTLENKQAARKRRRRRMREKESNYWDVYTFLLITFFSISQPDEKPIMKVRRNEENSKIRTDEV